MHLLFTFHLMIFANPHHLLTACCLQPFASLTANPCAFCLTCPQIVLRSWSRSFSASLESQTVLQPGFWSSCCLPCSIGHHHQRSSTLHWQQSCAGNWTSQPHLNCSHCSLCHLLGKSPCWLTQLRQLGGTLHRCLHYLHLCLCLSHCQNLCPNQGMLLGQHWKISCPISGLLCCILMKDPSFLPPDPHQMKRDFHTRRRYLYFGSHSGLTFCFYFWHR